MFQHDDMCRVCVCYRTWPFHMFQSVGKAQCMVTDYINSHSFTFTTHTVHPSLDAQLPDLSTSKKRLDLTGYYWIFHRNTPQTHPALHWFSAWPVEKHSSSGLATALCGSALCLEPPGSTRFGPPESEAEAVRHGGSVIVTAQL